MSTELRILKESLRLMTKHMNELIEACTDDKGNAKAPDRSTLARARACLPQQYSMAFKSKSK